MTKGAARLSLSIAGVAVVVWLAACGTTTPTVPGLVGDATAGATEFNQVCTACHTVAQIQPAASRITNNMAGVSFFMTGITLTDQQVADLQAFLAAQ
jgi:mono/diheme cytochrome c family protein